MKIENTHRTVLLMIALITLSFISCDKDDDIPLDEVTVMINQVRAATQAYRSHAMGIEAGWEVDLSGCVEHPVEGGMGHHFARLAYIDGRINHLEPQILLYAPDANGNMEFVGVEYIIPFEILPENSTPPELFGEQYHKNHELEIWALHAWTEKENPKGMFYDWNPNVGCN